MAKNNVPQGGLTSGEKKQLSAFSDKRDLLIRGYDDRCSVCMDEPGECGQSDNEPSYILIGRFAPDYKLEKLALRFGYTLDELQAFRDAPEKDSESDALVIADWTTPQHEIEKETKRLANLGICRIVFPSQKLLDDWNWKRAGVAAIQDAGFRVLNGRAYKSKHTQAA